MGGCASSGYGKAKRRESPMIVDVQQTVADAVWEMFYVTRSRWQRICLRKKDYTIDVPMNYFHFQMTKQELYPVETDEEAGKDRTRQGQNGQVQSLLPDNRLRTYSTKTSSEHVGLETVFKNSTGEKQTYNFRFEKSRKATTTVTYQKGFSVGGRANFSLGLPKVLPNGQTTAELDMRVCVTKTTGETFEQTLTTCTTSDITVAPHSHYTATVVMEERNLLAKFKVWVMMSMPAEEAQAFVKNKQGDTIFFCKLRNLSELFPEENHLKDKDGKTRSDAVEFVNEGRVDGMQLSNHYISLTDHELVDHQTQVEDSKTVGE